MSSSILVWRPTQASRITVTPMYTAVNRPEHCSPRALSIPNGVLHFSTLFFFRNKTTPLQNSAASSIIQHSITNKAETTLCNIPETNQQMSQPCVTSHRPNMRTQDSNLFISSCLCHPGWTFFHSLDIWKDVVKRTASQLVNKATETNKRTRFSL